MKYIAAISGGVDSVVLLDLLAAQSLDVVVAHVDHGIRPESADDEAFVRSLAERHGMQYVSVQLNLRADASEELARDERYRWLEEQRLALSAESIVTAHHQDDVLETMIINLQRGTGWRGLCSLRSRPGRTRPMLEWNKAQVVAYALDHGLTWREDSTNDTPQYLRNRIRSQVIPRLTAAQRRKLIALYHDQLRLSDEIEYEVLAQRNRFVRDGVLQRYETTMVDEAVAHEVMRSWLGESLERRRFSELLLFLKVAKPGRRWSVDADRFVLAKPSGLIVERPRD